MKYKSDALIDTRPLEAKAKDYQFEEIVAKADPVVWQTKHENDWRTFPILNQERSNQCVAFTLAKMLGIQHQVDEGEWIDFSPSHIYERRSNFPAPGMNGVDAFEIVRKEGATFDKLYPTKTHNNDNETLSIKNHYGLVGEIFKISNYLSVPINIDTIASIIQRTKKGVMIFVWGNEREWVRDVPQILDTNLNLYTATVRHSVTAVDYFIYKGKKAILIEDSWGLNHGMRGRRIITEDFFKRVYYAGHIMNFKFEDSELKVKHSNFNISKPLQYGMLDEQVKELQRMLQVEGFFPSNVTPTNYYGNITAKAVLKWQLKHKVDTEQVLRELRGHFFGRKSLQVLNM